MGERDSSGRFIKGKSANPSGRPKSSKLTTADRKELAALVKETVKDDGLVKEALTFLLKKAELKEEVFKYFKEFLPYVQPKLASMAVKSEAVKKIVFQVEGFDPVGLESKPMKTVDPLGETAQEAIEEGLASDEEVEELMDSIDKGSKDGK